MWKNYLSIKSWWPISKSQEVEGGSSGREIGTLGDSQSWEDSPWTQGCMKLRRGNQPYGRQRIV